MRAITQRFAILLVLFVLFGLPSLVASIVSFVISAFVVCFAKMRKAEGEDKIDWTLVVNIYGILVPPLGLSFCHCPIISWK